jgi:glycosyltransferase involved in cell wall biosynthesis
VKVALLSYDFPPYCVPLANGLTSHAEVALFLPEAGSERWRRFVEAPVDVHLFEKPRLRQAYRQLLSVRRLTRQIQRVDPDVVHLQAGHPWFNLGLPLLRRRPLVVTIHEARHHLGDLDSARTPQRIKDFGYRRADEAIVHGEAIRRDALEALRLDPARVHVVPTGPHTLVDGGVPPTAPPADPPTVLFFGRIWPYKGLDHLIEAEPAISEAVPDVRIVIAGRGEDLGRYRAMMRHPERFQVLDEYVDDERAAALFREATVVVLPYVDASISGVVLTAYAYGRPVVVTSVGMLAELVDDGRSGLVIPARDAGALAAAVVRVLREPGLAAAMGAAAAVKARTEYDAATAAAATIPVYEAAIRRKRGRG